MPLYERLPEDSVRLLRLLPLSDDRKGIHCQLFTCPILKSGSTHPYEALSYVWGPEDNQKSIHINNCEVSVRTNLYEALSCLQDHFIERIMWIDAICINQEDKDEKGHQVQCMAKIYARASRVIVWLGGAADQSNEALEAIREVAEREFASSLIDEAIIALLDRPWFKRIWVLQEVAAARHILIKSGRTEIDGYAFCAGLSTQKILHRTNQSHRDTIPMIVYLIRGATFRPRYEGHETSQLGRFTLNMRPLSQLVDTYHTRQATDPRDKVYALLGMSSDSSGDLDNVGLSPNYQMPWKEVFRNLVKLSTSDQMSVTVWDDKEVAVIKGKGCILGQVSEVKSHHTRDDIQIVTFIWKKPFYQKGNRESHLAFPASAKTIEEGDTVYLLQGARLPSIVRLHDGHLAVIMIAIPLPEYTRPITAFRHEFSVVWDWEASQGKTRDEGYYEGLMASWGEPKCPSTECRCHYLHEAIGLWNSGLLLNGLGRHEEAGKSFQKAVKIYGTALRAAESTHDSLADSDNEALSEMDDIIMEKGADTETKKMGKMTPLLWAVVSGHESFVRLLLDTGADVDAKGYDDDYDRTPLWYAVYNRHKTIIQLLLDNGANVNAEITRGFSPLQEAASAGDEAILRLLLDRADDVDGKYGNTETPLFYATWEGHETVVRLLLEKGANANARDIYGSTPLFYATRHRFETIVRLLLDHGGKEFV